MTDKRKVSDAETDKKKTPISDTGEILEVLVLEVQPVTTIPDGRHEGIITALKHRSEPFGYIDVSIKEKKTEATLKIGFPDKITEKTQLGKFLMKMGIVIVVGTKIDLRRDLLAKTVSFMTENEENEKGVFARVIQGTVKPLK